MIHKFNKGGNNMEKLYFNTGVKPWNCGNLGEYEVFINNEKNIEFYINDIPEGGKFQFICPKETLENVMEGKSYYQYREILEGGMKGYAIFLVPRN
jgi:hypothetical protein